MSNFENYVDEVLAKLPVNAPIYTISSNGPDSKVLYLRLKQSVEISLDPSAFDDPLERLIAANSSQGFVKGEGDIPPHYKRTCYTHSVFTKVVNTILKVYKANCKLKNPEQSVIFRWVESQNTIDCYDTEAGKGLVALYRYIAKVANTDDTVKQRFGGKIEQQHAANVLAILEKMRDKYGKN